MFDGIIIFSITFTIGRLIGTYTWVYLIVMRNLFLSFSLEFFSISMNIYAQE